MATKNSTMVAALPITMSAILAYQKTFYYYLCYLWKGQVAPLYTNFESADEEHSATSKVIIYVSHDAAKNYLPAPLSVKTWRQFVNSVPDGNIVIEGEGVVLMPISIFHLFNSKLAAQNVGLRTYNALWRVFSYYYFQCCCRKIYHNGLFKKSVTTIAAELGLSSGVVSDYTNRLIEMEVIEHVGTYKTGVFARQVRLKV